MHDVSKLDESEVLTKLNNMSADELKAFRERNAKHRAEISKHKVKNKISTIEKRIIDITAGLVGCILLIPITVLVCIMKLLCWDWTPLFFIQKRIGRGGKLFKMIKFQSMCNDADRKLYDYLDRNPEAREEYKINKKLKDDPRITKVGKILRRTSLDEFPQMINILVGQMSLVGPRPYLPREKEDMGDYYKYIIDMKPGLTGPWQVAGRSNLTFEDRLKLDEEYCSRRGNRRDVKILWKTFMKVAFGKDNAI